MTKDLFLWTVEAEEQALCHWLLSLIYQGLHALKESRIAWPAGLYPADSPTSSLSSLPLLISQILEDRGLAHIHSSPFFFHYLHFYLSLLFWLLLKHPNNSGVPWELILDYLKPRSNSSCPTLLFFFQRTTCIRFIFISKDAVHAMRHSFFHYPIL